MSGFSLETRDRPAHGREIAVRGELDIAAVPALDTALRRARGSGREVALDLSRITFLDICAARSILSAVLAASPAGQTLTIASASPAVRRMLTLMGADDLVVTRPASRRRFRPGPSTSAGPTASPEPPGARSPGREPFATRA